MSETAKRAFVAAVVVVAVVADRARALEAQGSHQPPRSWGIVISAAMRPGVEWLAARRVPRGAGIALHYLALLAFVGLLLWLAVPRALNQVQAALGVEGIPTEPGDLDRRRTTRPASSTRCSCGCRTGSRTCRARARRSHRRARDGGRIGIFFTLAVAAYWIFERDRAIDVDRAPRRAAERKTLRDTWHLIDLSSARTCAGRAC